MSNDELRTFVVDELSWEPKVDVEEIAVDAEDGVITLRGTVGSLREKREAKRAAERVYGVKGVDNSSRCASSATGGATMPSCGPMCSRRSCSTR